MKDVRLTEAEEIDSPVTAILREQEDFDNQSLTHSRACPQCGNIIPWAFGKPQGKYGGKPAKLICPEHGEFRNPAELKALKRINGASEQ